MPIHPYYTRMEQTQNPGSIFFAWNWAAFLLGPVWFAYRKCYFYAFLTLMIEISYGGYLVSIGSGLLSYKFSALIPLRILVGSIGTSLYFRKWIKGRQTHYQHKSIIIGILFAMLYAGLTTSYAIKNPFRLRIEDFGNTFNLRIYEFKNPDTFDPGPEFDQLDTNDHPVYSRDA